MSNQELLAALAEELSQGEPILAESIGALNDPCLPQECVGEIKKTYCDFTRRVADVAEAINLASLKSLMAFIDTNLSMYADTPRQTRDQSEAAVLLQYWPTVLSDYIRNAGSPETAGELRDFLDEKGWPWRVDLDQFDGFIQELQALSAGEPNDPIGDGQSGEAEVSAQSGEALSKADVSTDIPDDVSPKLLETFQVELPQATAELSGRIQQLAGGGCTLEDISDARRVAHTLKGAANIVGVVGIANMTHHLEDLLEYLVNKKGRPTEAMAEMLTATVDCLEQMSEAALGMSEPPAQALEIFSQLLEWKGRLERNESEGIEPIPRGEQVRSDVAPSSEQPQPAAPTQTPEAPRAAGKVLDTLLSLAGELSSSNLLTQGQLQAVTRNTESLNRYHQSLRTTMSNLQDLIYHQGLRRTAPGGKPGWDGVAGEFDPLEMDQYNEFHSIANLFAEMMDDVDDTTAEMSRQLAEIRELLNQQDQLNKQLDRSITAERLVSVKTVLPRLQRIVRQTCRMVEKQAELNVRGESLYVDNYILDTIIDPILHILRNAIDHGVESPAQRQAQGKPETAVIDLSFERKGNYIVVTCRDDGQGIDAEAVKEHALSLGLITPEEEVSEKDLHQLILQPGFSTKPDATQVSGRGVGMDVVANRISQLRGSLSIESRRGEGSEFTITVPQTLLKTHVVLLKSEDYLFGILSSSFEQIIHVGREQIVERGGKQFIDFANEDYEIVPVRELVGIAAPAPSAHKTGRETVILARDDHRRSAVIIDQALGNGQLVVKRVGKFMPKVNGIAGTVLSAEGVAAPVFDLKELLRQPPVLVTEFLERHADRGVSAVNILIVDDSSSARRSLSQVARDAGYDVRTAIDGVEAVTLIEEHRPDLVLTDLEMPKMNGLELAAHLRSTDETRDLPIVMVTSRSTEKHREQAMSTGVDSYITKPFTNDDLVMELHQLLRS